MNFEKKKSFSRKSRFKVTYMFMALTNSLVVLFIGVLLRYFDETFTAMLLVMPPTLKKWGGILVSACPYVCTYDVCMYVCIHVRDIVLKLHVWIPHGKIADTYFWFSLNYLPLSNYGPLTNKGMKFCKCHISKSIIARNLKLVSADRG